MGAESMIHSLTKKVALITGGSRGIGFATARTFLQAGANVALVSQNSQLLAEACERLASLGELEARALDVRNVGEMGDFIVRVRARFGRIDILVNNAGKAWGGPIH